LRAMQSRRYPTDLSDNEWRCIGPHTFPGRQDGDAPGSTRLTGDPERRLLLRPKERLPMAAFAPRLPAFLEVRLRLVQEVVAHRREVGAPERWAARALALAGREGPAPQRRRHRRLPVCEDDGGGVGGEQRGYDGAKKVRGRKRHLLVDTEGLVLEAKVHSAKVPEQDGIGLLLERARDRFPRLSHLWVDAGSTGVVGARSGRSGRSGLWA
jgi:putative transposase